MEEKQRDICYKELLTSYKEWAENQLKSTPEARSLMLVVDWEVGDNDFPPGTIVGRSENLVAYKSCISQVLKMVDLLVSRIRQILQQLKTQQDQAVEQK